MGSDSIDRAKKFARQYHEHVCFSGFHWHNNANPLFFGSCVKDHPDPVDVKKKQGQSDCTLPAAGNPCNPVSGNKFETETDYTGAGPFALTFERFYNSTRAGSTTPGAHWRHTYQRSIEANGNTADAARADGQILTFTFEAGAWVPDPDVRERLEEETDDAGTRTGWRLTDANDTVERYDAAGRLISITNRDGFSQTLAYDTSGRLQTVTGPFGRTLTFTHDAQGRLSTLADPAGNLYQYGYDADGNLAAVSYPDDTPDDASDNPLRTYHYENTAYPFHLTGIRVLRDRPRFLELRCGKANGQANTA